MSSKLNSVRNPSDSYQKYIGNVVVYCAVNGYFIPAKFLSIPPSNQFGDMCNIKLPSEDSNTVQSEIFDLTPAT